MGSNVTDTSSRQAPLTPPDSSRRTSKSSSESFGSHTKYPQHVCSPIFSTPLRPDQGVHGQYLNQVGNITDVFASIAHGNDYSFFKHINGNPMISPAASRGSCQNDPLAGHYTTPNSICSDSVDNSYLMTRSQSEHGPVFHHRQHHHFDQQQRQQSFSMPSSSSWAEASRRLQFVTSADMETVHAASSMGSSVSDCHMDGGPLPEHDSFLPDRQVGHVIESQPDMLLQYENDDAYHRATMEMYDDVYQF